MSHPCSQVFIHLQFSRYLYEIGLDSGWIQQEVDPFHLEQSKASCVFRLSSLHCGPLAPKLKKKLGLGWFGLDDQVVVTSCIEIVAMG